ncbi:hypothetical protein PR048_001671 [Dryococelus australis]|uniref:Uncharacterized protein n=1 Tax=Dryococelus australis TaxID=614101 RepID=A0ABQ9IHZ3_9NEOP|nr:hypothetical protein PR048_001671 [Dryococelus australis]
MNNLTSICGFRVQIEQYRQPKKPLHCFKCQGFGNHSKCCGLPETCVICAGNHHSKLCHQKLQSTIAYKCANCEGSHKASDKVITNKQATAPVRQNSQKIKQTLANFPQLQLKTECNFNRTNECSQHSTRRHEERTLLQRKCT